MVAQRKPRKKCKRNKRKASSPAAALALKACWADPEFRERMRQRDIARLADCKANPEKYKRTGIPDGMHRAKAQNLWAKADKLADRFIQIMKDKGELPVEDEVVSVDVVSDDGIVVDTEQVTIPTGDTAKAEAGLRAVCVLAFGPSTQQIKIQAINTLLAYTKSKPEAKSKLTLSKPEDFLDAIANDS